MLSVRHLKKHYETPNGIVRAVEDVSFDVAPREFVAIVGPSGAGKSTILRMLTGLGPSTSGDVLYKGQRIDGPPEDFAPVFQDYARSLFPWFTVEKNVMLPLVNRIADPRERREVARRALERVGLAGHETKRPTQLSGGQQQRVAIARAIAFRPSVLIMDEPFASVDAQTRADLEDLVLALREDSDASVIFVTHDVDEAVYMSNRVLVLSRSPSSIMADEAIALPERRDQIATKALPEFARARARILGLVREAGGSAAPQTAAASA